MFFDQPVLSAPAPRSDSINISYDRLLGFRKRILAIAKDLLQIAEPLTNEEGGEWQIVNELRNASHRSR